MLFALSLAGCMCTSPADFIQLDGFEILKYKREYSSNENLLIEYHFISSEKKSSKKKLCLTYNKKMAGDIFSDKVLTDSTKVFCNKDLLYNKSVILKNTNLLNYQLIQTCTTPTTIKEKENGFYYLNLSQFSFINNNAYIFTIQVQTNNKILTDTFQISIKQ